MLYTIGKLVNINKYTILVGGFNPSEYPEISMNNKYPLHIIDIDIPIVIIDSKYPLKIDKYPLNIH